MPQRPDRWIVRNNESSEPLLSPGVMQGGSRGPQTVSAFRAFTNSSQSVPANAASQVLFPVVQFDLAKEYNPNTSTFTPRMAGVYSLTASVEFQTALPGDFTLEAVFLVNQDVIGRASVVRTGTLPAVVTIFDILQLRAGDTVTVAMRSTAAGAVQAGQQTHFAAARVPSPTA
ncbi:hypothetical protein J7E20_05810 [Bacillus sp. ISL-26]|uniref:C1q-like domain-containing protein n=1 Tax=Bacillus sp. ISL-26 TaxID=2819119 RepID=UPI001BE6A379|nr:hypothetical protein [Bacillus sp. ISL-26]MBT2634092.1 hypothetical protein [Bacillus sp. ISL-26]